MFFQNEKDDIINNRRIENLKKLRGIIIESRFCFISDKMGNGNVYKDFDKFPQDLHVECVVLMSRVEK